MRETNRSVQKDQTSSGIFFFGTYFGTYLAKDRKDQLNPPASLHVVFIYLLGIDFERIGTMHSTAADLRWTSAAREVRSPRCYGQSFFLEGCHHEVVVYIWL